MADQIYLAGCRLIAPSGAGRGQNAQERPHPPSVAGPYLAAGSRTECAPATMPAGKVFVLGDNRAGSADSWQ